MKVLLPFLFVGSILIHSSSGFTQTCCSGGVPVSNNVGMPESGKNQFNLAISYDYNKLGILKQGSERLGDDIRRRLTHSVLLQGSYGITDRLAVEALISYVNQQRKILTNDNITETSGLGDVTLLARYLLINDTINHQGLSLGAGTKLPTGSSDKTTDQGIGITADLQPGSGAADGIFWLRYFEQLAKRPSASLSAQTIYSLKGRNKDYLNTFEYKFGDELQLRATYTDQFALGSNLIDPALSLRYRNAQKDVQEDFDLPNTGGNWIYLEPAFTFWIAPKIGLTANSNIPVYANVTGTQLSTSFRLNTGIFLKPGRTTGGLKR